MPVFLLLALFASPVWGQAVISVSIPEDGRQAGAPENQRTHTVTLRSTLSSAGTGGEVATADPLSGVLSGLEFVDGEVVAIPQYEAQFVSIAVQDFFGPSPVAIEAATLGADNSITLRWGAFLNRDVHGRYTARLEHVTYSDNNDDSDFSDAGERVVNTVVARLTIDVIPENDPPVMTACRYQPAADEDSEGECTPITNEDGAVPELIGETVTVLATVQAQAPTDAGAVTESGRLYFSVTPDADSVSPAVAIASETEPTDELTERTLTLEYSDIPYEGVSATLFVEDRFVEGDDPVLSPSLSFVLFPRPLLAVSVADDATFSAAYVIDGTGEDWTIATGYAASGAVSVVLTLVEGDTDVIVHGAPVYRSGAIVLPNLRMAADEDRSAASLSFVVELSAGDALFRVGRVNIDLRRSLPGEPTVVDAREFLISASAGQANLTLATLGIEGDGEFGAPALTDASMVGGPLFAEGEEPSLSVAVLNSSEIAIVMAYRVAAQAGGHWEAALVQNWSVAGSGTGQQFFVGTVTIVSTDDYTLPALEDQSAAPQVSQASPERVVVTIPGLDLSNVRYTVGYERVNEPRDEGTEAATVRPSGGAVVVTLARDGASLFLPGGVYEISAWAMRTATEGAAAYGTTTVTIGPVTRDEDGFVYDVSLCLGADDDDADDDGVPDNIEARIGTDCNSNLSYFVGESTPATLVIRSDSPPFRAGVSRPVALTALCDEDDESGACLDAAQNGRLRVYKCPGGIATEDPANDGLCTRISDADYVYLDESNLLIAVGTDALGNWLGHATVRYDSDSVGIELSRLSAYVFADESRAAVMHVSGPGEERAVVFAVDEAPDYSLGHAIDGAPVVAANFEPCTIGGAERQCATVFVNAFGEGTTVSVDVYASVSSLSGNRAPMSVDIMADDEVHAQLVLSEVSAYSGFLRSDALGSADLVDRAAEYTLEAFVPLAASATSPTADVTFEAQYSRVNADGETVSVGERAAATATLTGAPGIARGLLTVTPEVPDDVSGLVTLSASWSVGEQQRAEWRFVFLAVDAAGTVATDYALTAAGGAEVYPGEFALYAATGGTYPFTLSPSHTLFSEGGVLAPLPGASSRMSIHAVYDYRVVLPAGPADATAYVAGVLPEDDDGDLYEVWKYRDVMRGWMRFGAGVYGARGSPDVNNRVNCPRAQAPLEGGSWHTPMRRGDRCIMFAVRDGGPNDNDGDGNGHVLDPVALMRTEEEPARTTAGSGGGGGGGGLVSPSVLGALFALIGLAGLLTFARVRRARQRALRLAP